MHGNIGVCDFTFALIVFNVASVHSGYYDKLIGLYHRQTSISVCIIEGLLFWSSNILTYGLLSVEESSPEPLNLNHTTTKLHYFDNLKPWLVCDVSQET